MARSKHSANKSRKGRQPRLSATEQRNPRSMNLDKLPLSRAIKLMLTEEAAVPAKLLQESTKLQKAIELIVRAFRRGGRLFYVGAGTSGRLGVLDASECPPTFRTDRGMVQGIIAGGKKALWRSVEGAEDNAAAAEKEIQLRKVTRCDVVVGIAASGRTPFVWGAIRAARRRGAATILLCFNPYVAIPSDCKPTLVIVPDLGPEILTGSTRLKAGTATKLVLNLFTTLAMVRMGKVRSNLMIDLNPSNSKLRERAVRIVCELSKANVGQALDALKKSGWVVSDAIERLNLKAPPRAS
jgi:N-acetylmuramic acid 6-phosphate etherase